jgi:hypothetical protein
MIGVIAGDIIGSVYENRPRKSTRIRMRHPHSRYTDDTVLTCATAIGGYCRWLRSTFTPSAARTPRREGTSGRR